MNFTEERLTALLAGRRIGVACAYCEKTDSTNILAWQMAMDGAPEGTVVVADTQTRGKGRLNRVWQSPPGANIYVSIILRPEIEASAAPQLTLVAGLAVAELLTHYCPEGVSIKWPNDILLRGKKICGILTEMKSSAAGVEFIILGIGININMSRDDFEPSLRATATSLKIETGEIFNRLDVVSALFNCFEKWYRVFLRRRFSGVREAWLRYADIVGRPIRVVFREDSQTGLVMGIDDDGTIVMKDAAGAAQRVIAGDIYLLKE